MAGVVGSCLVLLWIAEIKRMVARVVMQKGGKVGTKRLEKALEISIMKFVGCLLMFGLYRLDDQTWQKE